MQPPKLSKQTLILAWACLLIGTTTCDTNWKQVKRGQSREGFVSPEDCGKYEQKGDPFNWPFFGTLVGNKKENSYKSCSAALLSPTLMITSQTCLQAIRPQNSSLDLRVILGAGDLSSIDNKTAIVWSNEECSQKNYKVRPSINGWYRSKWDYELISLGQKVELDNKYIGSVCVSPDVTSLVKSAKSKCYFVGQDLAAARMGRYKKRYQQVEHFDCWAKDQFQFCFRALKGSKPLRTCKGDSGGPIVCLNDGRWNLVGFVSTVAEKCDADFTERGIYNVATNISHLIESTVFDQCVELLVGSSSIDPASDNSIDTSPSASRWNLSNTEYKSNSRILVWRDEDL